MGLLEIGGFALAFTTALVGWLLAWTRARDEKLKSLYGLERDLNHLKRDRETHSRFLAALDDKIEKLDDRVTALEREDLSGNG